jgi:hypothetical protein
MMVREAGLAREPPELLETPHHAKARKDQRFPVVGGRCAQNSLVT